MVCLIYKNTLISGVPRNTFTHKNKCQTHDVGKLMALGFIALLRLNFIEFSYILESFQGRGSTAKGNNLLSLYSVRE